MPKPKVKFRLEWAEDRGFFDLREPIKGTIHISCREDFHYEYLSVCPYYELRGESRPVQEAGQTVILEKHGLWKAGERYSYPFSLQGGLLPTFYGNNLETDWTLHFEAKPDKEKMPKEGFSLAGLFRVDKNPNYFIRHFRVVANENLSVVKDSREIPAEKWWFLLLPVLMGFLYLFKGEMHRLLFFGLALGLVLFFIFNFFTVFVDLHYFRNARIHFTPEEDNYISGYIHFSSPHSGKNKIRYGYMVEEKVIDDRGTSQNTLKTALKKIIYPDKIPMTGTRLPLKIFIDNKYPPSLSFSRHSINWYVLLEMPQILGYKQIKKIPVDIAFVRNKSNSTENLQE